MNELDHAWQTILGLVAILAVLVHGLMKYVIPYIIRTKVQDAEKQTKEMYSRLDQIVVTCKQAFGIVNTHIGQHEENATKRHERVYGKLETIDRKIDLLCKDGDDEDAG